ncbi:cystatin-like fold lipoprotein [Staphylococcus epidermidis]
MLILIITVVGCNKGAKNQHNNIQYHDEIKKDIKNSRKKHIKKWPIKVKKLDQNLKKEKVNRYVFKDGKLIIISYKLFKNKEQLFYVAYEIKGEKVYYKRDINPKDYIKEHKPDCKDIRRK